MAARRRELALPLLLAGVAAAALALAGPSALDAGTLLLQQNDPVALADHVVARTLDPAIAEREIAAALDSGDAELAASFLDLARDRGITVEPALAQRVATANSAEAAILRTAGSFGQGLVTGEPQDGAGFAGTALGDLFVFGDVRDAVREGSRLARGQEVDEVVLGLACVGLVVTAGTYASLGAVAPARIGVSLLKGAWRSGRMAGRLAESVARSVRGIVDFPAAGRAVAAASWVRPAAAVRGLREAVKVEKADGLTRMLADVGRVQSRAGTRAALDGLRITESPKEISRLAKLAEKKGSKMRAILKLGGRAAIVLTSAVFSLASWAFTGVLWVVWLLSLVKGLTERITRRCLNWGKRRRTQAAAAAAPDAGALACPT